MIVEMRPIRAHFHFRVFLWAFGRASYECMRRKCALFLCIEDGLRRLWVERRLSCSRMGKSTRLKERPTVIDLFCGAGGLSYGFLKAGCDVLLGVDSDAKALETFELNHPGAKTICGDITAVGFETDIAPLLRGRGVDVIVGGPPCQGMSLSGPRKFEDPRNRLYLSYIRLVSEIRPKAFVIENVPGLVSLFNGRIKDSIVKSLTSLGYAVQFKILAAEEYGVPQRRRRVVFVGIRDDIKCRFEYPKPKGKLTSCSEALSDLPSLETSIGQDPMIYPTEPLNAYQRMMRRHSHEVRNHVAANHTAKVRRIIAQVPDGGNYKDLPADLRGSRNFHVAWTRFAADKPAPTIDTGHRHHFHYRFNRVPTVRECARLQSFPDDFIFLGNKTQQFRQVGNAVPPLLAKAIALRLIMAITTGENAYVV